MKSNDWIETIKITDKVAVDILQDNDAESPREWDNVAKMYCFHRRYILGDKHNLNPENYNSYNDMIKHNFSKEDIVLPLYLYDHSGLSISTSPFSCRFDSGQVGFIVVTKETIIKEYGEYNEKTVETATKVAIGEVETYNSYLIGDIYGYRFYEIETCSLGHTHESELESCFGFYGKSVYEEVESLKKHYSKQTG